MSNKLARDDRQSVMQIGAYNTPEYVNLDGSSASAATAIYAFDTVVRIKSYYADNWLTIGSTAITETGLLLQENEEIYMQIYAGEQIATIGGKLNIVSLGR